MPAHTHENRDAAFTIKHRAVCDDDNYKGKWRSDIEVAKEDARGHRAEPGNQDHVIRIVTQQSLSMTFTE